MSWCCFVWAIHHSVLLLQKSEKLYMAMRKILVGRWNQPRTLWIWDCWLHATVNCMMTCGAFEGKSTHPLAQWLRSVFPECMLVIIRCYTVRPGRCLELKLYPIAVTLPTTICQIQYLFGRSVLIYNNGEYKEVGTMFSSFLQNFPLSPASFTSVETGKIPGPDP